MPCHSFPHAVLHMYSCINNYPSGIHKANNNNYVPLQHGLCVTACVKPSGGYVGSLSDPVLSQVVPIYEGS